MTEMRIGSSARRRAVHGVRVLLFVTAILLIRSQHLRLRADRVAQNENGLSAMQVATFFSSASSLSPVDDRGHCEVRDADGRILGRVLQTSPASDHILGFSGPTNVLVALDTDDRILGIDILASGDTRDHLRKVKEDESFRQGFVGLSADRLEQVSKVDAVSGATLTSRAIQEAILHRFRGSNGRKASLRFPDPLTIDQAQSLLPGADRLVRDENYTSLYRAFVNETELGAILRTSPVSDNSIGYQGPTGHVDRI